MDIDLKELIKDNTCKFLSLRTGFAQYCIWYKEDYYTFFIPLDDIGNGTLNASEKAITLMRWIRKAIENNEFIKQRP